MTSIFLADLGITCALGTGRAQVAEALFATTPLRGLTRHAGMVADQEIMLGSVNAMLPDTSDAPRRYQGRNNALLMQALEQIRPAVDRAIARHGPARVAVVLGTSTSGVGESETAQVHRIRHGAWPENFEYAQQEMGTPAHWIARLLGILGPAHVISTACSSSAKALASAARMLRAGMVDAVVAGGADSLCAFTVAGFRSLESVAIDRCNPFSANRRGINIGEGAALFLLDREDGPVRLLGWGESSDAHHMSAPEPSGRGAADAIGQAMQRAGLRPTDIDYINLHGTATVQNDAMESRVVAQLFGAQTPCSSTKPMTGHTLGAAGAIEAGLSWLTLVDNSDAKLPPHWWDGVRDPGLSPLHLVTPGETAARAPRHVLSQSFAFGGSNAALVLGSG